MKKNLHFIIICFLSLSLAACSGFSGLSKSKNLKDNNDSKMLSLKAICEANGMSYPPKNLKIKIDKIKNRLDLYVFEIPLKSYRVGLGANQNKKMFEGDKATPEGMYKVLFKQRGGLTKSMLLNYPNLDDMKEYQKNKKSGIIPKDKISGNIKGIGGGVKLISGDINKKTDGSIVLSPADFKEIFKVVKRGVTIEIKGNLSKVAKHKKREKDNKFKKGEQEKEEITKNTFKFKQGLIPITDASARDVSPKFSPDGKRITFSRVDQLYNDVWVWKGEHLKRVTLQRSEVDSNFGDGVSFSYGGTWSQDPNKFMIISSFSGNYDIYLFNLDNERFIPITKHSSWDGSPAWSPDGRKIVFVSARSGNGDLWLKNLGRWYFSNPEQLTTNLGIDFAPIWGKDSNRIFYASRQYDNYDIFMIDLKDEERIPVRLTFKNSAERYISVSPDGKHIAFFSGFNIGIMNIENLKISAEKTIDGYREINREDSIARIKYLIPYKEILATNRIKSYTKKKLIVKALTAVKGPLWSPDGKKILFVANLPLKPIYLVDNIFEKKTNIYEVNTDSEIHRDLDWSPDGKKLIFVSFRDTYSKYNNNINGVYIDDPNQYVTKLKLISIQLPEFITKQGKTYYQITSPPPQDVSFINRGRLQLQAGFGIESLSGGR